jgi:hypothetical protein
MLLDSYPPKILSIDSDASLNDRQSADALLNLNFLSYRAEIGDPVEDFCFLLTEANTSTYGIHPRVSTNRYPPLL